VTRWLLQVTGVSVVERGNAVAGFVKDMEPDGNAIGHAATKARN